MTPVGVRCVDSPRHVLSPYGCRALGGRVARGETGMRKVRYQVACSLDGSIAGPNGEYDWIVMDPDVDFEAMVDQFDTLLMGRRTFEVAGTLDDLRAQPGPRGGSLKSRMRPNGLPSYEQRR